MVENELAKRLNVKCYDNELLAKVSENYNIDMTMLEKVDEYLLKTIGKKITRIQSYISFEEQFYTKKQTGKYKGEIYGFPWTLGAWCNDRLKLRALNKHIKTKKGYISYIGIAYDEPKRFQKLGKNEKSPLYEWKMTETDCLQYTKEKGLYNSLYDKFNRLGCWFCIKQGLDNLRILRKDYPELWKMLLDWQLDSAVKFRTDYSVQELEEKFKKEEISLKI